MWDGFNQRKFPRVEVQCDIQLIPERSNDPISTVTANLGVGGVCVNLEKKLEKMKQCKISVKLDEKSGDIKCIGQVAWAVETKSSKNKKVYDIGIQFIDCGKEQEDKIRTYLEKLPPTK